ncbi:MAG: hypothetical protein ACYCSH_03655 [Acidithiobacillus sp.]
MVFTVAGDGVADASDQPQGLALATSGAAAYVEREQVDVVPGVANR